MKENFGEITYNLFVYMRNNQEEALRKIGEGTNVQEMLVFLLEGAKNDCFNYIEKMSKKSGYRKIFDQLRTIDKNISHSAYISQLKKIYEKLKEYMMEQEDNPEIEMHYQAFVKMMISSHLISVKDQDEKFSEIKKKSLIAQKSSIKQKNKQKVQEIYEKNRQNVIIKQKEKKMFLNEEQKIDCSQVVVFIRYFDKNIKLSYEYGQFGLKEELKKHVILYLKENVISFSRIGSEITILQNTSICKSKDAGNFFIDPFCDSIEVKMKMKNEGKKFLKDVRLSGNFERLEMRFQKVEKKEDWRRSASSLKPKDSINVLINKISERLEISSEDRDDLIKIIKDHGAAAKIEDLFTWVERNYEALKIKTTYMYQILETIQMIKDEPPKHGQKNIGDEIRDCLRVGTAHKVLRYLVYQNYGSTSQQIENLPWMNFQNSRKAIALTKQQIHNSSLLNQLERYFDQFCLETKGNQSPISYSRGLLLYGPPGTGKTVLTQSLPNIIGFHLIERGLSAADFMKSIVGESSRMIRDLVNRAKECPYWICSLAIDQVDGLVPDRKDKDEKNKGEGISMILSVVGGNKDVSNLVFMTSTNFLKKIDEAVRRRFSGQYMVGRPNPKERQQILLSKIPFLKNEPRILEHLIHITTNFTGAALKAIGDSLDQSKRTKQMMNKGNKYYQAKLTEEQATETAILTARQFSITLGVYTLPEIFKEQKNQKNIFTKKFIEQVPDNFIIVQKIERNYESSNTLAVVYLNKISKYSKGRLHMIIEKEEEEIFIPCEEFKDFQDQIKAVFNKSPMFVFRWNKQKAAYSQNLSETLKQIPTNNKQIPIFLIEGSTKNDTNINMHRKLQQAQRNRKNIYAIFYLGPFSVRSELFESLYKQEIELGKETIQYQGRIFVQLNKKPKMAMRLKTTMEQESQVAFKHLLKSESNDSAKGVMPELVKFFTEKQVSYILLLDYELLLNNGAFQENKMLEIIDEKMSEAKNYERVAVIINADSLISLSANASDSNFGRSMSYSVVNHNMYQLLMNYMKDFALINDTSSKWLSIIAKNIELIKTLKKDLDWPEYPEQAKERMEEEEKDQGKLCFRCQKWYTERKNKEERTCMQHPGDIINIRLGIHEKGTLQEIKKKSIDEKMQRIKNKQENKNDDCYIFSCCGKNIFEEGHKAYYHISKRQFETKEDELWVEKNDSFI